MADRIAVADRLFRAISTLTFNVYDDQYELLGNPETAVAKFTWDTVVYFAFLAPAAFGHHATEEPFGGFASKVEGELQRLSALNAAVRNLLKDWYSLAGDSRSVGMATVCDDVMDGIQANVLDACQSEVGIVSHIRHYVGVLEVMYWELLEAVAVGLGFEAPDGSEQMLSNDELREFRLSELPKRAGPAPTPKTFSSAGGLCWAARDWPEGVRSDNLGAWPCLGEGLLPPPEPVPYPLPQLHNQAQTSVQP